MLSAQEVDQACSDACSSSADRSIASCVAECAAPVVIGWREILQPVALICLSALFSGLTLGLMSLDKTGLEIIVASGEEPEKTYAEKILPVRKRGNELLCTLLLSNTLVNAVLSIFMGSLTSGIVGGLLATAIIVVFGEIIPQATCSRHALLIGASTIDLVRVCMLVLAPVTWPLAKVLDYLLGHEITSGRSKRELEHLLRMQDAETVGYGSSSSSDAGNGKASKQPHDKGLTSTEKKLLGGALTLSTKKAHDVMTAFDDIFMVDIKDRLDFQKLREIYRSGYTRVPVHNGARTDLHGVLNTKDLVLVDADDELAVRSTARRGGRRRPFAVP